MQVHTATNEHPYVTPVRLKDARPVHELPSEAAKRAMPPAPPPPQPIINSIGQPIGSAINVTA